MIQGFFPRDAADALVWAAIFVVVVPVGWVLFHTIVLPFMEAYVL